MQSKIAESQQKWYVLVTKPNAEKQTSKRLSKIGIENYLPLQRELRVWHDRKKWVEVPLFKSYVFVKTFDNLRKEVYLAGGVLKYVTMGDHICILSQEEVDRIQRLCACPEAVVIEKMPPSPPSLFALGDEVEVMAGPLQGFRGHLIQQDGQHRLRVEIKGLGYFATVIVDENIVRKAP